MLLSTIKNGDIEIAIYSSSNIFKSEYNENGTLKVFFKNGSTYIYEGVVKRDYFEFKLSDSQGKELTKKIKNYPFTRGDNFILENEIKVVNDLKEKSFLTLIDEIYEITKEDLLDKENLSKKIENNILILNDIKNLLV